MRSFFDWLRRWFAGADVDARPGGEVVRVRPPEPDDDWFSEGRQPQPPPPRDDRPPPWRPPPPRAESPPVRRAPEPQRESRAERDRQTLIDVCIDVSQQVSSTMLREQLTDALEDVGVLPFDPAGERFDPRRHEAKGRKPTADAALDGLVAATQQPGYRDRGEVIRKPEVLVWRREPVHTEG